MYWPSGCFTESHLLQFPVSLFPPFRLISSGVLEMFHILMEGGEMDLALGSATAECRFRLRSAFDRYSIASEAFSERGRLIPVRGAWGGFELDSISWVGTVWIGRMDGLFFPGNGFPTKVESSADGEYVELDPTGRYVRVCSFKISDVVLSSFD
ncbi:hypothetical protein ACLOJK_004985 [Asimina triloba]